MDERVTLIALRAEVEKASPHLAATFEEAAQALAGRLGPDELIAWAEAGRGLIEQSPELAAAYFRASPQAIPHLQTHEVTAWAELGRDLHRAKPPSTPLGEHFFQASPELLQLGFAEGARIALIAEALAARSPDTARKCLERAAAPLSRIDKQDRHSFLSLLSALSRTSWANVEACLEMGPRVLSRIERENRGKFLALAEKMTWTAGGNVLSLFRDGSLALGQVGREHHARLLWLAEKILSVSPQGTLEFLRNAPVVVTRLRELGLERWAEEGTRLCRSNHETGVAFFRLESARSQELLRRLSRGVELHQISDILRLYCKALTGRSLNILPADTLANKGIGWVSTERPSTEGTTIFLPPSLEVGQDKGDNFAHYKTLATHQAGHLEFGSFEFSFEQEGNVFPTRRVALAQRRSDGRESFTDLERFFDLFPARRLASDLFTIAEDGRVDSRVKREYRGIRGSYQEMQRMALSRRSALTSLPLRPAFVEMALRLSMGGEFDQPLPSSAQPYLRIIRQILERLQAPQATVEDSAEATLRLYALFTRIPNLPSDRWGADDWGIDQAELEGLALDDLEFLESALSPEAMASGEPAYTSPQGVDFRGDFKPELVQTLMKMRQMPQGEMPPGPPLSPDEIKELLEKSAEIEITNLASDGIDQSSGLFLSNLLREAGLKLESDVGASLPKKGKGGEEEEGPLRPEDPDSFVYDEWDFQLHDYRPQWCLVRQKTLEEGDPDYYDETLKDYAALVNEIRRQFEMIRPDPFKKVKRLNDGEDFDLDAVIEAVVERKAKRTPSEKLYWRRNKVEREVAVAFLLDMSASTDEDIDGGEQRNRDWAWIDELWEKGWRPDFRSIHKSDPRKYRRIIDVEKESTVLLVEALETIGDSYGIYGFSGYGRDNVEFFVVKDIEEGFGSAVRARIDKIAPVRGTRMGPAIRHAITKLEARPARLKLLFLVSDGRPQDHDYGMDRTEKEYALHDTRMALLEAKRKDIVPFCLTVDRGGSDWLRTMCEDMGYAIVADIEELPRVLPNLYRRLTA